MPEIWIPYGKVEVPIDIKTENLDQFIENNNEEIIKPEWNAIPEIKEKTIVIITENSITTEKAVIEFLKNQIEKKTDLKKIHFSSNQNYPNLRRALSQFEMQLNQLSQELVDISTQDGVKIKGPKELVEYKNKIVISEIGLDPLFGFSGGPISLLKLLDRKLIGEAFNRRIENTPSSGKETRSSEFASSIISNIEGIMSIETLPQENDELEAIIGKIETGHLISKKKFQQKYEIKTPDKKLITVISPGGSPNDDTLLKTLNALFNSVSIIPNNGTVILCGECSLGIGSESLWKKIIGDINFKQLIKEEKYIEGLETIMFLEELKKESSISLVSTLPNLYVDKLNINRYSKVNDALEDNLSKYKSRTKVRIIPKASRTIFNNGI